MIRDFVEDIPRFVLRDLHVPLLGQVRSATRPGRLPDLGCNSLIMNAETFRVKPLSC